MDKFSKFNPHTIDNIKLYLKLNGYNNKLISKEYKLCDKKLIFTCETCKKEYEVTFKHFRNSNQTRCKECSTSQSTIEKLVKDYLECNNYNYIQQYIFEDCCDIRPLLFDFCILNNENIGYLIEVDGRQHYEIVEHFGGESEYEYVKKHDNIKNKYCKDNNIKLIRIPYWEFKKNNYINILKNKLQ